MIKQNIFIINYISLYEILEEIKENLSFRVIKYEHVEEPLVKFKKIRGNISDT